MTKIIDIATRKNVEKEPLPETVGEVLAMFVEDNGLKSWLKKVLKGKDESIGSS
jgi:hypothetical protein